MLWEVVVFAWKPFDAICRLFTARRNPCLILLSVFTFAGLPHIGLFAVCVWTLFSSALMTLRFLQATFIRLRTGPLNSWLKNEKEAMEHNPRLYKAFSSTLKLMSEKNTSTNDDSPLIFVEILKEKYGKELRAVILYGSWVRGRDTVIDFYVVLDSYKPLNSRLEASLNHLLAPNVYNMTVLQEEETIATKYATVSAEVFKKVFAMIFIPTFGLASLNQVKSYMRETNTFALN